MGYADKTEIRISKLVLRLPTLRVGPQFRDKFKIRISKCSKQILEDKYRDLWVLVILILSIRICFVLRASDFGFSNRLSWSEYGYLFQPCHSLVNRCGPNNCLPQRNATVIGWDELGRIDFHSRCLQLIFQVFQ